MSLIMIEKKPHCIVHKLELAVLDSTKKTRKIVCVTDYIVFDLVCHPKKFLMYVKKIINL